jgi:hypothetical protein
MDSDADKIIDLYERHAHDYAADRRSAGGNESAWLDRFSALLSQGAPILDIGCGSGDPIARHLIDQGFAVDIYRTRSRQFASTKPRNQRCAGSASKRGCHICEIVIASV